MKHKILVAIKDEFIRKTYVGVFREEGFEILETDNGEAALNLTEKENPDIILADVFLSPIGGLELIEALKKKKPLRKFR
jgi:CheY-like chemotaxis protein